MRKIAARIAMQSRNEPVDVNVGDPEAADRKARVLIPGAELHVVRGEEVREQALDAESQRVGDKH